MVALQIRDKMYNALRSLDDTYLPGLHAALAVHDQEVHDRQRKCWDVISNPIEDTIQEIGP